MSSEHIKTVLITGAAGGLGSALSMVASLAGWRVVMTDKDKRGLERVYDAILSAGGLEPYMQILDLARIGPDDCEQLVDAMQSQLGKLDAIVHCAVAFDGLQPLDLIAPDVWLQQVQVNVNAPWLLTIRFLRLLKRSDSPRLYFILDQLAESKPLWGAYGLCKAAIRALAVQFHSELKTSGIKVHSIEPGPMRTALRSSVFHSENPIEVTAPDLRARQLFAIMDNRDSVVENYIDLRKGVT